jgi:hypothetical protein
MIKSFYSFLICFTVFTNYARAQTAELEAMVNNLAKTVGPVQSAAKKYEPSIKFIAPAVVQYSYNEIDAKGTTTNYAFDFNLADIDPYAVREQTQKDLIYVVVMARNKQKLIKTYKNEEVQPYESQALIIAQDIENARAITDLIKKAIPVAGKVMEGRLKLSGYDAMATWLTANVKKVDLGTKSYTQTLEKGSKPGSFKYTVVETNAKAAVEEIYTFNLADIYANALEFKINGNRIAVNIPVQQKADYISLTKNGEVRPYVNELNIYANSVDEARDLKTVLTLAIPLAAEKVKADIPAVASDKDALQRIQALTTEITRGPKQTSQSIEAQCLCTLTQIEKDTKSSKKNEYRFHWMDVNPNAVAIEVSGDRMFVKLTALDSKKLIMNTQDDKFSGYENSVRLYMPDIEHARRAKFAAEKASEKCKLSYKEPFGSDVLSQVNWIKSNVKDVTLEDVTLSQKLEPVESGKNDKLKYTRKELNAKGSGAEEVYEFNLSDINPLSVDVSVKGKWLYVTMETNFKGKIIKYYKDGKPQPYTSTIEFALNDVDASRSMISALKKSSKALAAK